MSPSSRLRQLRNRLAHRATTSHDTPSTITTAQAATSRREPWWPKAHRPGATEDAAKRRRDGGRHGDSRVRSTVRRIAVHLVNTISNTAGDDIIGRVLRRSILRTAGAAVPRSTHLHGATYFSRPAHLRTGERCLINRGCYLDLHGTITLGDDVVVGHGAAVITSRHEFGPAQRRAGTVTGTAVVVESGAWLGANVTILPGITVGSGAVVAAGAVVTGDVAANTVVAGVPAQVVRRLDQPTSVQACG
jgi:maltose O-acetyltransferase